MEGKRERRGDIRGRGGKRERFNHGTRILRVCWVLALSK